MKLRLQPGSMSVRLSENEVQQLIREGRLEEQMPFIDGSFNYRLELSDDPGVRARLNGSTLAIQVSRSAAVHWAASNDIALDPTSGSIVIERDLDRRRHG